MYTCTIVYIWMFDLLGMSNKAEGKKENKATSVCVIAGFLAAWSKEKTPSFLFRPGTRGKP